MIRVEERDWRVGGGDVEGVGVEMGMGMGLEMAMEMGVRGEGV